MDLNEAIDSFRLNLIPENWVKSIWQENFSVETELPPEYELQIENTDYADIMITLAESVKAWLEEDSESVNSLSVSFGGSRSSLMAKKNWQSLLLSVDHKALLCFLSTFFRQDARNLSSVESMILALAASRLYLALLSINGSHVYQIFNSLLYSQALEAFKVGNVIAKSYKQHTKKSQGRKKANQPTDEDCSETLPLSQKDKLDILNSLIAAVEGLHYCLRTLSLKDDNDSLAHTVNVLVTLTKLERTTPDVFLCRPTPGTINYLVHKSYLLISSLCVPEHGETTKTIHVIMTALLPAMTESEQPALHITPREVAVIREHTVHFVNHIVRNLPKEAFPAVKALVQQLCIRVPDKAEIRAKSVQNITEMLNQLPIKIYNFIVAWIISMCHADLVRHRVTGIELLSKLININEKSSDESSFDVENENYTEVMSSHKFILAAVLSRCCDISPTVRVKALSVFGSIILSKNPVVENIFVTSYSGVQIIKPSSNDKRWFDLKLFFSSKKSVEPDPLPSGSFIVVTFERLAEDEKVFVRKNALHALCNIYSLNSKWITEKRLDVLVFSCKDKSVAVRKMLVQSLTDLVLKYPNHHGVLKCWAQGVIPLIGDNEVKSQERVLETMESIILSNLVLYKERSSCDSLELLPWKLLTLISNLGFRRLFRYACKQWTIMKRIKDSIFNILKSHIGTENNLPAWFLLVCITEFQNMPDATFVLEYYYNNIYNATTVDEYCSQLVIEALHLNWRKTNCRLQEELYVKLKDCIETFSIPLPLIARSIDICHLINPESIKTWGENLIYTCENFVVKTIGPGCNNKVSNEPLLAQYIFTLGELTQFCPKIMKLSTISILTNLIDPEYEESDCTSRWEGNVSDQVKAVTVATLGKLCLQDQFIAKSLVPSLGNLLSNQWQSSVKINAIIALTDLCVRFTSLVESYLGDMCVCLRDPDISVRTNTLTLLMQLIQEDFLRLRCPYLFYILFMLEDESSLIREQAAAFLVNTVLAKNPSIMYQHFLQAVFFYNDYEDHASYSTVVISPQERAAFCIPGEGKRECRRKIYRYMLEHMLDDHRFKVTYRLCTEVLDEVSEDNIKLDEVGTFVLQDSLFILACDEIRLDHLRKDAQEDDSGEVVEEVITHVRKTIISQLVKKNYIENIVPIIIRLKHKLKEIKSSLVRDLMICLRELMKDFKTEINEILAADPELASEVTLDLRLTEEEQVPSSSLEEDEEVIQRREQLSDLMKEARIECVRLSEEVLVNGGINLGSPPSEDCGIDIGPPRLLTPRSSPATSSTSQTPPGSGGSTGSGDANRRKRGRKRSSQASPRS